MKEEEEILTPRVSEVVIRREVKTRSLALELLQVGLLQRAGLRCGTRTTFTSNVLDGFEGNATRGLTEEVQVSALLGGSVLAAGHAGVRPQDAVGAGRQVVPHVLVDGGVEVN